MSVLLKVFYKIIERILSNSFYETNITLVSEPDKDTTR